MESNIYYNDARKSIIDFFAIEFPSLPQNEVEQFIQMFYKLSNYEEEGTKIRPNIFVCNNINAVARLIPNCQKIQMYSDKDSTFFKQRIKALIVFCRKNWSIYINYTDDAVEYGLIKTINSIKDRALTQLVFDDVFRETLVKKISLININVISGGMSELKGLKNNKVSICFNLSNHIDSQWEDIIREFVGACVSKIKTTPRKLEDIKNLYANIFQSVFRGLHGTICLVIDKDYKDSKGFLADGTWLKDPIEFGKLFLQSKNFSESKLTSFADLLVTMLDYDGITVLDNAGRIRAYNVFIESSPDAGKNITGGARRRAAYTLLESKYKKIIGVYFQSQDGDNFYKDTNYAKRKKKAMNIVENKEYKQLDISELKNQVVSQGDKSDKKDSDSKIDKKEVVDAVTAVDPIDARNPEDTATNNHTLTDEKIINIIADHITNH